MEPWRVCGPTVVRIEVKGWIRISIKVMRIRNPAYTFPTLTNTFLSMLYTFPTLIYNFPKLKQALPSDLRLTKLTLSCP
jgi:hypothetical protein